MQLYDKWVGLVYMEDSSKFLSLFIRSKGQKQVLAIYPASADERDIDEDMDASSTSETATTVPAEPQGGLDQPATVSSAQERRQTDNHHDHEDTTEQTGEPQPFSSSEHAQLTLDRSSERTLLRTTPQQELAGSIRVDRSRVVVGEAVGVAWDVNAADGRFLGHMDFLGMFEVNEGAPVEIDNLLDSKLRGVCNSQSGHVNWLILPDHFNERTFITGHVTCM